MFHSFKILAILFFFCEPDERNVRTIRHALKRVKFIELVGCARHTADMRTLAGIRRIIGPINQCCVPVKLKNELETLACHEKLSGNHLGMYTQNASAYAVRILHAKSAGGRNSTLHFQLRQVVWFHMFTPEPLTIFLPYYCNILLCFSSLLHLELTCEFISILLQYRNATPLPVTLPSSALRAMCRLDFSDTAQLSATGCSESTMHALRPWQ